MPLATASLPPPVPTVQPGAPVFSAGSVIGRSFSVWFANFVPFSIVTLAVNVPVFVRVALVPVEEQGWNLLNWILSSLGELVTTGGLTYGVLESLRGGRVGIGALFGTGFRKMGWVFAVSFRVGLWLLLGTVLLVVPAVIWFCALFVAVPAVVVETNLDGSGAALQRSRVLTDGSGWAIFAIVLVIWIATFLVSGTGVVVATLAEALPHPLPILFVTVPSALVSSLGACASAVAYNDLRSVKEGVATADLVKVFE